MRSAEVPVRVLVVVPTYDEATNIVALLDGVLAAAPDVHVLVVDDNSPDGTAGLVEAYDHPGVFLLSRAVKDGLGGAYRAGFRWALDHDYEVIAQMDADLSHPPQRLPALLGALDDADLVIGSRYVPEGRVDNWTPTRRLISAAGNVYVRAVLGLPVRDATAGFKVFRREALVEIRAVDTDSDGYCFQVENTWRSVRLGLRVVEVPITFTDRTRGASKMSRGIVLEAVLRVLVWRGQELLGRRRAVGSRPKVLT